MNAVDRRIVRFIRRHHVLTLATAANGQPWCANIFYAYNLARNAFVYSSDPQTRHSREATENPEVSASIVLETRVVGRVKGIQITGCTRPIEKDDDWARHEYLKRFPYAATMNLDLWILEPHHIKFTDNTLGFGTKLIYQQND